jgi:hypothetical protein
MQIKRIKELIATRIRVFIATRNNPRADGAKRRARVLSPRLFTPDETKSLAMTSQTAPDWQLQIGESGASSRYNFNMELERLVCKQTALAA